MKKSFNRKALKAQYMGYKKSFLSCRYKSKTGKPKTFFNWKNRGGFSASYKG
jgi:hypothetical protein